MIMIILDQLELEGANMRLPGLNQTSTATVLAPQNP